MESVNQKDLVIHTAKNNGSRLIYGVSIVQDKFSILNSEPPLARKWAQAHGYFKIPLESYLEFDNKPNLSDFFSNYSSILINRQGFYQNYNGSIRLPQKYLVEVSRNDFILFNEYFESLGFNYDPANHSTFSETDNEPIQPDASPPNRVNTSISRIVRDTELTKAVKRRYNDRCQICGNKIKLKNGKYYSEGHHIHPLGASHNGPDIVENIIVLCPNHHAEFDYGLITLDLDQNIVIYKDNLNPHHNCQLNYSRNDISRECLNYHNHNIFNN